MTNFYSPLFLMVLAIFTCEAALYNDSDPIVQLNVTNFKSTISNSSNAWIVEFYNSWCGHCINFAPTWRSLAVDVSAWKNVISVAAIDCNEAVNLPICQEYNVTRIPAIKFYKPKSSEFGYEYNRRLGDSVEALRKAMIKFLESLNWPDLNSTRNFVLPELFSNFPSSIEMVAVVSEKNDSFLGREVMLDLMDTEKTIKVLRIENADEETLKSLNISDEPSVVTIKRDLKMNIKSPIISHNNVAKFVTQSLNPDFKDSDLGEETEDGAGHKPQENESQTDKPNVVSVTQQVYMVDLENAINYTLFQELALHSSVTGDQLTALKSFINLLVESFPGRQPVKNYLTKIKEWLEPLDTFVFNDFVEYQKQIQTTDTYLPSRQPWISCLPSKDGLRGYPCSMWLLLHTLTVESYNLKHTDPDFDPLHTPTVIANYIKHFFSCEECSQHFQQMAATMNEEPNQPTAGILWFWRAHNKVNSRLRGSPSEDPMHPKRQFPKRKLCNLCKSTDVSGRGKWNEDEVAKFLINWYSQSAINISGVEVLPQNDGPIVIPNAYQNHDLKLDVRHESITSIKMKHSVQSSWGFSALDMSLCLVLYLCSAVILLVVYFVVIVKRRMRKKNYQKVYLNFI